MTQRDILRPVKGLRRAYVLILLYSEGHGFPVCEWGWEAARKGMGPEAPWSLTRKLCCLVALQFTGQVLGGGIREAEAVSGGILEIEGQHIGLCPCA